MLGDSEHCLIPGTLSFLLPHFLLFDLFLDGGLHVATFEKMSRRCVRGQKNRGCTLPTTSPVPPPLFSSHFVPGGTQNLGGEAPF